MRFELPWQVWFVVGVAAVAAVWRYFGLRQALLLAGGVLLFVVGRKGKQEGRAEGYEARKNEEVRHVQEIAVEANRARNDADARNADPERLRDDDGYRRD